MKITVENLGVIKKGSVELPKDGGMTIFAGANNSGKSYMSYLVYGIYQRLVENGIDILTQNATASAQFFAELFGKKDFSFPFQVSTIPNKIPCYFFPAERATINQLAKEIMNEKAIRQDYFRQIVTEIQNAQTLKDKLQNYFVPRYALPINDYIYWVFDMENAVKQPKTAYSNLATELEYFLGGRISISSFGDLEFTPFGSHILPLHLSSSLVKSLSGIVIYFRHLAKKGDVIMIDEPELNLHPENQVRLARVLAKIANRGFNLIFSTHSDYILKELSNLTILANDFDGKDALIERYDYDEKSFLPKDKIKVYAFQNQTIEEVEITDEGFDLDKIDEVISDMAQRSDNIRFSFLESSAVHE